MLLGMTLEVVDRMDLGFVIMFGLLAPAGVIGVAFLAGRLMTPAVEVIAESPKLTDTENETLFPKWFWYCYPIASLVAVLIQRYLAAPSVEPPRWPSSLVFIVFAGIFAIHCLRLTRSRSTGGVLPHQAKLGFIVSAFATFAAVAFAVSSR